MDKVEGLFAILFESAKGQEVNGPWEYEEAVEYLSRYISMFQDSYDNIRLVKITFLD